MLKSEKTFKILTVAVVLVLLIYSIGYISKGIFSGYSTQTAILETVTDSVTCDMFIIRDETLVYNNAGSTLASLVSDGEKVGVNTPIAGSFRSRSDAEKYIKRRTLEDKLAVYEKINNQIKQASADIESLSSGTAADFLSLVNSGYNNDFSSLADTKLSFDENLTRLNLSVGYEVDCDEKINAVVSEMNACSNVNVLDYIYAENAGYFVKNPDGFENLISTDEIDSLTEERLTELLGAEKKTVDNCLGKTINNFNWYVACIIDKDCTGSLSVGSKSRLILSEDSECSIVGKVYSLTSLPGDRILVVYKCNTNNPRLFALRKVTGKIVLHTYKGLKIPKSAIKIENDTPGVFVLEGDRMSFNRIQEIYSDEKYVYSENSAANGMVWQYDEVIVSGKELYNDKTLN